MDTEKILLRNLSKLKSLFNDFSRNAESNDSKEAFISAEKQCDDIISKIENQNFHEASRLWNALMYFSNDSIGISENFLSKFEPLKQQVINSGL